MDEETATGGDDLTEEAAPPRAGLADDRSLGHLTREVAETLSRLIRKEVELAREETTEIVRAKLIALAFSAVTLAIILFVVPFALLTVVEVLAIWLPRWAASLIVTLLMIAVGLVAALAARRFFKSKMLPEQSIESIKEDLRWARNLKR